MEQKISVVVTVKNDDEGVKKLLSDLEKQTVKPDEVIIVESGRNTKNYIKDSPWHSPRRILSAGCSRGRGRNIGIRAARNELVAVTDVGCRPHRDWIQKFIANERELVSANNANERMAWFGWYRVVAKTELQKVIGYFLVPRKYFEETPANKLRESPLPASRSIAFTKAAWQAVGGYPENAVSGAEDLEFARRLANHPDVKKIYRPEALVDWEPPKTLFGFFKDIVKHTRGNMEVRYWPHLWRNLTVVGRWGTFVVFPWMIPIYLVIKVVKIIRIVKADSISIKDTPWHTPRSILFISVVQIVADTGVIVGIVSSLVH